jgi:Nif-specific regulatory protein
VRIVAATNRNLEEAVGQGRFREDLFYRIHVLPIRMPSLAERLEDLPDLAHALVTRACATHRVPRLRLSNDALRQLLHREWPGNVRQLENLLEAGVVRAHGRGKSEIHSSDLFVGAGGSGGASESEGTGSFQDETRRFQHRLVTEALEANDWNVAETARRLDISRSHLYTLIRDFHLERTPR